MPRVVGIDLGTTTVDLCGLDDGRIFLEQSFPTSEALADPSLLVDILERATPLDLVAGPSGYGLPLARIQDVSEADLQLAYLPDPSQPGGILGVRRLARALARTSVPIVFTPGVVHLPSVPPHRKLNRVDLGTADKVCVVALAIHECCERLACGVRAVSFILLELGGAFSAAVVVESGRIVDGVGGTSGPIGLQAAGALDGEVAFLAGSVTKRHLFSGGVAAVAGAPDAPVEALASSATAASRIAWDAYLESAVKTVAALAVSGPHASEIIVSGRVADVDSIRWELSRRLASARPENAIHRLAGLGGRSKQGAQGAAIIADGLAGGRWAPIVDSLGIRDACGTVLDYLYVISSAAARSRLGIV